jgi:transposase
MHRLTVLPKSHLGKAITYALNNWRALCRFLVHGELEIDNNRSERAIRPFAIGRKNGLFAGSREGGRNAAIIASFVATCKEHKVNPQLYLKDVIMRLTAGAVVQFDELLPGSWVPSL